MPNRLAKEKSPYLLQHAHNPVDWYPWGEEALARAKREDKPLILSIGYSTCHWCHVMERESFENDAIAKLMNESFVCVKLDREERPDVDKIYMTAVQAMTGQGGWPLNLFLTPEGQPFYGGTYFPPEPRWGQPSWPALLGRIAELWRDKRAELRADAARMTEALREYAKGQAQPGKAEPDAVYEALAGSFDEVHKGFGHAPKFPMPANLHFLLRHHARTGKGLPMVVETLKAMAAGGVFDQVGGGFHRYSVDEAWRVPHFEKMLYDNAQLAAVAWEAHLATGDAKLKEICERTLAYLKRDLRHPEGGFYSAEDADSEGREGAFYVWRYDDLPADIRQRYGAMKEGNAPHDPHGEFTGLNILHDTRPDEPAADMDDLLRARAKRVRPHLDDKILASWNGLAISAFAKAGDVETAEASARFLKDKLWDGKRLWRRWRDGERAVPGTADDYAFVAQGLLDLFEATGEWLDWALELTRVQQELFAAPGGGLYMTTDGSLIARVVEDTDNVEPCASSVAAGNLLRLWRLLGEEAFRKAAVETLERFGGSLRALPYMAGVAETELLPPQELVIVGPGRPKGFNPARIVVRPNPLLPWLPKEPGFYLCENRSCRRTESA